MPYQNTDFRTIANAHVRLTFSSLWNQIDGTLYQIHTNTQSFNIPFAHSQSIPEPFVLAVSDIRKLDVLQVSLTEYSLLLCRRQLVSSLVLPHVVGS